MLAAGDLSTKQHLFVKVSASDTVDVCSGATDQVLGVLQNKPAAAGEAASVLVQGVAKVIASAAINAGALVGTTNAGKAVTKAADADKIAGIALTTVSNDGELVEILLTPGAQRAS